MAGSNSNTTMALTKLNFRFEFNQRHVAAFLALTSLICLITLFYSVKQLQIDWELAHRPLPKENAVYQIDETTTFINRLPYVHLFGIAVSKMNEIPASHLQLQLTGIVFPLEGQQEEAKAYISIDGQASKIFQIGNELPYGVKINAITQQAVLVENNGRLEKLTLSRIPLQFKAHKEEGE